jgi:hypothetical protein
MVYCNGRDHHYVYKRHFTPLIFLLIFAEMCDYITGMYSAAMKLLVSFGDMQIIGCPHGNIYYFLRRRGCQKSGVSGYPPPNTHTHTHTPCKPFPI